VPTILSPVLALQRGTPQLSLPEYTALRRAGVAALRKNQLGFFVQSGVTTSQLSGQKDIRRRRFADYVEDSISLALLPFSKLDLTPQNKDGAVTVCHDFCNQLLSPNQPQNQRISAFSVDDVSGNTPQQLAVGIFVIFVAVQMLPEMDFITLRFAIGPGVQIANQ